MYCEVNRIIKTTLNNYLEFNNTKKFDVGDKKIITIRQMTSNNKNDNMWEQTLFTRINLILYPSVIQYFKLSI